MTWIKKIPSAYHQQDNYYYCGAASAQMILDSRGTGLKDQDTLYCSNHSHNIANWYTDPAGLTYTLNHYKPSPPTFNNYFVIYTTNTELEGTEKIVHTLWKYGVSAAALVNKGDHWVVVHGVSTSVEPAPGSSYSINGFWIHNPWPHLQDVKPPLVSPPPHSATDGCGSGGNRGNAAEYAVYNSTWKDYFTAQTKLWGNPPSVWYNKYHSVCDPSPPELGQLVLKGDRPLADGDRFIEAEQATDFALRGVEEHNLRQDQTFELAMRDANPMNPVLVQRLDIHDTFYYLVPFARDNGLTLVLSVDGLYGNFRGGLVLGKETPKPFIDRDEAYKRIVNQHIDLEDQDGRITIRKGAFFFYPLMVWRPCRESRSPFYPFFMITVGSKNIYIGFDGTIYPELHDAGPGA